VEQPISRRYDGAFRLLPEARCACDLDRSTVFFPRIAAVADTEEQLISTARDAVSQCNWVVGECATRWTQRFARGRTDADFGQLVGLSGDQIFQRRRVWEAYGDSYKNFSSLKWSFFYVALNWDDAEECLNWAQENGATVAEMRAWRKAQRGEDLFAESAEGYSEWAAPLGIDTSGIPLSSVVDPAQYAASGEGAVAGVAAGGRTAAETMAAAAREGADGYAPFRPDATKPPVQVSDGSDPVSPRPELTPEQVWKKVASTLDRLNKVITKDLLKSFDRQPEKIRARIVERLNDIGDKMQDYTA
jgi:hypothetical protein